MKKPVLRTGDLANRIGVQPEAIRYYESRGLLSRPQRGLGGYRIYTPEHLRRVEFIKKCQALGFSLDEIHELMELKFLGHSPCPHVHDLLLAKITEIEAQIARLEMFRQELHANARKCGKTLKRHTAKDDFCPFLERIEKKTSKQQKRKSS
jgi:DNA-binding transcriptional MerR regulator